MSNVAIDPATIGTHAAACKMLGMDAESRQATSPDSLLLVARDSAEVVAAASGHQTPGGRGILRLPTTESAISPSARNLLVQSIHDWFRDRHGPVLVQTLVEGDAWIPTLERFGYRRVTEILDLEQRSGSIPVPTTKRLQFENVTPTVDRRLIQLLRQTYTGSTEFEGLPESRDAAANLQDYLAWSGAEALWCVVRFERRDIGLLLMGSAGLEAAQLLYLGIVPEVRRQGFGLMTMSHALRELQRRGIHVVRTSVDIVNDAAIHCYVAADFYETGRRKMLVCRY